MSNLLPLTQKKSILRMYRKRFVAMLFLSLACLGFAGILLLSPSYFFLRSSQIVLMTKENTMSSQSISGVATALAGTVSDINGRLQVFPNAEPASPLVAGLIDPILEVKDQTIHIDEFDFAPGVTNVQAKVTVSGVADNRTDLLAFADKVRAIGSFSSVDVPIDSFIKDTNVSFSLSAVVALKS